MAETVDFELGRDAATIPVTDMPRALRFSTEVPGTTKTLENDDPVGFVSPKRGAAGVHSTLAETHHATDRNVAHPLGADAPRLCEQLVRRGTRIVGGLREADFELRSFVFAGPDGDRLADGEAVWIASRRLGGARRAASTGDRAAQELGQQARSVVLRDAVVRAGPARRRSR